LITDGISVPKTCAFSGRFSDFVLLTYGGAGGGLACCADAVAAAMAQSATVPSVRAEITRKTAATFRFSLSSPTQFFDCRCIQAR
jgi:hypothetical protein